MKLLNMHLKENLNEKLVAYDEMVKPWKKLDIKVEIPTIKLETKVFVVERSGTQFEEVNNLQHHSK